MANGQWIENATLDLWEARDEYQIARIEELEADLAEMTRRRDAWKAKAEGYDEVRLALREKVGAPWPPNMSRLLWAGIAADEKKRAELAEAKLAEVEAAYQAARNDTYRMAVTATEATCCAEAAEAKLTEVEAERDAFKEAWQKQVDEVLNEHSRAEAAEAMLSRAYRAGVDACASKIQKKIERSQPELSRTGQSLAATGKRSTVYAVERAAMDARKSDRDLILALPTPTSAEIIAMCAENKETE